jgi:hypoxanthine phosphoribosyltransferase
MSSAEPWRRRHCYLLDWPAFGRAVETIAEQVSSSGRAVDAVVAIARGGMIPGGAIANLLNVSQFLACSITRNVGAGEYLVKSEPVAQWFSSLAPIAGRSVLVVDDVVGTGATVDLVRRRCEAA